MKKMYLLETLPLHCTGATDLFHEFLVMNVAVFEKWIAEADGRHVRAAVCIKLLRADYDAVAAKLEFIKSAMTV